MILRTAEVNNNINEEGIIQELSFERLISFLKQKIGALDSYEQTFPKLILDRIIALQDIEGDITLDNLCKYEEIFSYIYYLTSNVLIKDEIVWGMGFPIPSKVFYGQKKFFNLLDANLELFDESLNTSFYHDFNFSNKLLYLLVLERLYKLPVLNFKQLYKLVDREVHKYYQLKIDYSFIEVKPISGQLPPIDIACLHEKEIDSFEDIVPLLASVDLKNFVFKGFTILKLIDNTTEHVAVKIQNIISRLTNVDVLSAASSFNREMIWGELKDIVKTLTNSAKVESSFFPLLELNGVPILASDLSKESIFFGDLINRNSDSCTNEIYNYLQSPHTITYGLEESFNSSDELFVDHLLQLGIKSYVCFPLKNKTKLVGFLELFTTEANVLDKQSVMNVASFLPLIVNLAIDLVTTFKSSMDKVILDKYTSLQEAVQWKFNQEAANYLREVSLKNEDITLKAIKFEKVYPVYGAIDVRNSTKLRNMAYKKDSYQRLAILQLIVDQLESTGMSEVDHNFSKRFNLVKSWLDEGKLDHYLLDILSFFQEEVAPFLDSLDENDLILVKYKQNYLRDSSDFNGTSQQFEESLALLNSIISNELDLLNTYVQDLFPSYYEKFRTDGIEYDMYIGQSITPTKLFDPSILHYIRKAQIISMATIAKKTYEAMDDLPISLVTTQLVFIHPNPIDISFRQDERRFDVEGGYNIRYEVIKKRIDKAHIRDTNERLVQPNKIAIVYSSHRVEEDIRTILKEIANEHYIQNEIEEVLLEELQGVEQLKAFRVTVSI